MTAEAAVCICDGACPMTDDRHWVNCPAHQYHAGYLAWSSARSTTDAAEARARARETLAQHVDGDQLFNENGLHVRADQCVSAMLAFATAEAASGAGHWLVKAFQVLDKELGFVTDEQLAAKRILRDAEAAAVKHAHQCLATVGETKMVQISRAYLTVVVAAAERGAA